MDYIIARAEHAGSHWFEKSTMKWFGSRILPATLTMIDEDNWRFVSSERMPNSDEPRLYTVRAIIFTRTIRESDGREIVRVRHENIGAFQGHATARAARKHLRDEN